MPRFDVRTSPIHETMNLLVFANGEDLPRACVQACDTDEGWIDEFEATRCVFSDRLRVKVENGQLAPPVRKYLPFELRDKRTGDVLWRSKSQSS